FDCGGYVQFVFRQAGFDIPRTSGRQLDAGYKVGRANLKKGDLVFFTRWKLLNTLLPPSHVGIYIGGDRFIHAPSSGKTVRIDDLNKPYWRGHYKGARNLVY
ncbi:MAG: C40 family peptidase, partial [Desulfosalsimonas sp.]